MSTTDTWTLTIETELYDMLGRRDLNSGDLWRVAVLLGRAAQHPAPTVNIEALVDRASQAGVAQRALTEAARPVVEDVLDALDEALFADDDPAGPIADALLDVDDLLTVMELEGHVEEANTLATQAVALVDLAPDGPAALDQWATRRLATVAEDSPAAMLWAAVAAAGASVVLAAIPARREVDREVQTILDRAGGMLAQVIPLWSTTPSVRRAWRAAAADYGTEWNPGEGTDWTTYNDGGTTFAQVKASKGESAPQLVTLVVDVGGKRWTTKLRADRQGANSAWFKLGSEQELSTLFERARAELGVSLDGDPEIRIEWERDGQR